LAGGGHGQPGSPGPVPAAPPVALGGQVIGIGVDEQFFEHRVHDVPPQAGERGGPGGGRFQAMTVTVDSSGGRKIRTGT
jgi:hypothetical protein